MYKNKLFKMLIILILFLCIIPLPADGNDNPHLKNIDKLIKNRDFEEAKNELKTFKKTGKDERFSRMLSEKLILIYCLEDQFDSAVRELSQYDKGREFPRDIMLERLAYICEKYLEIDKSIEIYKKIRKELREKDSHDRYGETIEILSRLKGTIEEREKVKKAISETIGIWCEGQTIGDLDMIISAFSKNSEDAEQFKEVKTRELFKRYKFYVTFSDLEIIKLEKTRATVKCHIKMTSEPPDHKNEGTNFFEMVKEDGTWNIEEI